MYDPCIKTELFGKKVFYLPTCHSTNDIAAELLQKEPIPEGTVIITDNQTGGRGQRDSQWASNSGLNFTFSLIIRPHFLLPTEQFLISQSMALGVAAYVNSKIPGAQIKWPNDLIINNKKVAGMLIENSLRGSSINHAIVGIGLNMNQIGFEFEHASSLRIESGQAYDLETEFPVIMSYLEKYYRLLVSSDRPLVPREYLENLAGANTWRTFKVDNEPFEGIITGTSTTGSLMVFSKEAGLREFQIKEIEWVWD